MNIKFDSEPVYADNEKYIKTKIKLYGDKINTNFQSKKIRRENASYKYVSLIMLDSVIRANKEYYPKTLLEECKYVIKKKKMENLINDGTLLLMMNLIMSLIMAKIGPYITGFYYYYYYYYYMHQLYFCYGEVEMLRGSFLELQSSESSKHNGICSKKLFSRKSIA